MDTLTFANAFVSIVGLLSIFKQEQKDTEAHNVREFMAWLEAHNLQELKNIISQSHDLLSEIDKLLHEDHKQVMVKLAGIDEVLATISTKIDSFHGLVHLLKPGIELSEQAIYFLRALVNSEAKEIAKIGSMNGFSLQLFPKGGPIKILEARLIDDDLNTLVNLGLLSLRVGSHGTEFYGVTRSAIRLIQLTDKVALP